MKSLQFLGAVGTLLTVSEDGFLYDYAHHGDDWQGACKGPLPQSPINFEEAHYRIPPAGKLAYSYKPVMDQFELMNNGHALFADLGGRELGGISYDDVWYNVVNLAFKTPAEHTFNGERLGGEIHILHQKWDSPDFLVVAIPLHAPEEEFTPGMADTFLQVKEPASGSKGGAGRSDQLGFNRVLEMFFRATFPKVNGESTVVAASKVDQLDLNDWMRGTFFEYQGTTTVPPCSKTAWFVRREAMRLSKDQLGNMSQAILELSAGYGAYRNTQPLEDRMVRVRESVRQTPIPGWPPAFVPPNAAEPPAVAGSRIYKALRTEKDALTVAKLSGNYLNDLDRRIQEAAQAHASIVAQPLPGTAEEAAAAAAAAAAQEVPKTSAEMGTIVSEAIKGAADKALKDSLDVVAAEKPGGKPYVPPS
jgi:carbonic anhydrase